LGGQFGCQTRRNGSNLKPTLVEYPYLKGGIKGGQIKRLKCG
jgi:hypothetical protein